jgi:hypothetical protein
MYEMSHFSRMKSFAFVWALDETAAAASPPDLRASPVPELIHPPKTAGQLPEDFESVELSKIEADERSTI